MKPTPYLKQCLKELDAYLKHFPRNEKVPGLISYQFGLEFSLNESYPEKFSEPEVPKPLLGLAIVGASVGKQFGELEVESAREYLLAEIQKRKTKFSKPGFLERFVGK